MPDDDLPRLERTWSLPDGSYAEAILDQVKNACAARGLPPHSAARRLDWLTDCSGRDLAIALLAADDRLTARGSLGGRRVGGTLAAGFTVFAIAIAICWPIENARLGGSHPISLILVVIAALILIAWVIGRRGDDPAIDQAVMRFHGLCRLIDAQVAGLRKYLSGPLLVKDPAAEQLVISPELALRMLRPMEAPRDEIPADLQPRQHHHRATRHVLAYLQHLDEGFQQALADGTSAAHAQTVWREACRLHGAVDTDCAGDRVQEVLRDPLHARGHPDAIVTILELPGPARWSEARFIAFVHAVAGHPSGIRRCFVCERGCEMGGDRLRSWSFAELRPGPVAWREPVYLLFGILDEEPSPARMRTLITGLIDGEDGDDPAR